MDHDQPPTVKPRRPQTHRRETAAKTERRVVDQGQAADPWPRPPPLLLPIGGKLQGCDVVAIGFDEQPTDVSTGTMLCRVTLITCGPSQSSRGSAPVGNVAQRLTATLRWFRREERPPRRASQPTASSRRRQYPAGGAEPLGRKGE
jgi:hypothetical protein